MFHLRTQLVGILNEHNQDGTEDFVDNNQQILADKVV